MFEQQINRQGSYVSVRDDTLNPPRKNREPKIRKVPKNFQNLRFPYWRIRYSAIPHPTNIWADYFIQLGILFIIFNQIIY